MRFKIDENLPSDLADALRAQGHVADTVYDENLGGASDPVILEAASRDQRTLLTLDKGFGNLTVYPPESHAGLVVFRPGSLERPAVLEFVLNRLTEILELPLAGRTVVITSKKVRVR